MLLIGLGNKARQGKNLVAEYMQGQDSAIKVYGFCDELKRYCKQFHPQLAYEWQHVYEGQALLPPKEDPIYGYTQILQWYGTDVVRKSNPDAWVRALGARIAFDAPEVAIITDVRFPNEAEYIKQNAGYLVQVRRFNADGSQFLDAGRDPNHESEIALDDYEYDFVIEAKDGDLKSLKKQSIGVWNLVNLVEFQPDAVPPVQYWDEELASKAIFDSYINAAGEYDVPDSDSTGFK